MNKPEPMKTVVYDYRECRDYLKEKYPDIWNNDNTDEVWEILLENLPYLGNGHTSDIWMYMFDVDDADWAHIQKCGKLLFEEFGERDPVTNEVLNKSISFCFWW